MAHNQESRRNFFHLAGVGIVGASLANGSPLRGEATARPIDFANRFDVKSFGASGDGKTLDTPAINKAIEAAASAGGGTVFFPAGSYACYSIHLKSNVGLYLDHGATIVAADSPAEGTSGGFDPPEPNQWDHYQDFGHSHWHNSLIWGEGLENISVCGPGMIWGKGLSRGTGNTALRTGVGNKSIALKNCHNVQLLGFTIFHSGHFGLLATGVDNMTIDGLTIDTNRDGLDIDCCRSVHVSNCRVNSPWDDAICPKSSFALGYARATENVTISNCYVTGGYEEGTLLDGSFKRIPPACDRSARDASRWARKQTAGSRTSRFRIACLRIVTASRSKW